MCVTPFPPALARCFCFPDCLTGSGCTFGNHRTVHIYVFVKQPRKCPSSRVRRMFCLHTDNLISKPHAHALPRCSPFSSLFIIEKSTLIIGILLPFQFQVRCSWTGGTKFDDEEKTSARQGRADRGAPLNHAPLPFIRGSKFEVSGNFQFITEF